MSSLLPSLPLPLPHARPIHHPPPPLQLTQNTNLPSNPNQHITPHDHRKRKIRLIQPPQARHLRRRYAAPARVLPYTCRRRHGCLYCPDEELGWDVRACSCSLLDWGLNAVLYFAHTRAQVHASLNPKQEQRTKMGGSNKADIPSLKAPTAQKLNGRWYSASIHV